jgi:hypothetical protein
MIDTLAQIKRGDIVLRSFAGFIKTILLMSIALILVSCAPSSYYINMQYQPSKVAPEASDIKKLVTAPLTIAHLNDLRPGGDNLQVGTVVTSEGKLLPVMQKDVKPSKAVSVAIGDYLRKAGYTLTSETPNWNLQENAINKEWGKILIGGNIDKLEIICDNKQWVKKYRADVKISLFFADVQKGRIFYRISAKGGASLEHVKLSDETLEQQVNGALSSAIEDIFESATFKSKIQEALKQAP